MKRVISMIHFFIFSVGGKGGSLFDIAENCLDNIFWSIIPIDVVEN